MLKTLGLLLVFVLFPCTAHAIRLEWISGQDELIFHESARCTLLVLVDADEPALPMDFRLQWVAEGSEPTPLMENCQNNTSSVAAVRQSMDRFGAQASVVVADICPASNGLRTSARFIFELAAESHGKFRVVALDPSDPDSLTVIQTGIVTFNGGADGSFPPTILRTASRHQSTLYEISVAGVGLDATSALSLVANDGSWRTPLQVSTSNSLRLDATASLASSVPKCRVEAQTESDQVAFGDVPEDPPPSSLDPQSACQNLFIEDIYPTYTIQPKDFAFVAGAWTPAGSYTFHLFYIRHNQFMATTQTEKNIGHAVSDSLATWTVLDTAAIKVRAGRFDSQHVWAPNIVKRGLTYNMFYTGADNVGNQRIGIATSTDLINWTQADSVLDISQVPWADPSPGAPYTGQAQLRDPYVMPDPDLPGRWIMYFATIPQAHTPGMVVGMIRSNGNFHQWFSGTSAPLWATLRPYTGATGRAESPQVFHRSGRWWVFYTANHDGAALPSDTVYAVSNATSPKDTTTANWTQRQSLQALVPPSEASAYNFWHAIEYLEIGADHQYLAGFNDAQVGISYTQMQGASSPYLFSGACPSAVGVGDIQALASSPKVHLVGRSPFEGTARFRIEVPKTGPVVFRIYDVRGRSVRELIHASIPEGVTSVDWDGRDNNGAAAASGVYFASLSSGSARASVRVPFLR
jgi:beta-fructofuranosidase